MPDLKVTLIQTELLWEDIEANLNMFDRTLDSVTEETHLIVLPEMFTTGFTMNAKQLAQDMAGSGVSWLSEKAGQKGTDIVGSLIIREHGAYYNRLVWAKPNGMRFTYDKRHLFRMAKEDETYTGGARHLTISLNGWSIRPFICYDLRFPIWTRNLNNHYDLAIFIANWPKGRSSHWKSLLSARAIENQSYVVGCNRIGIDGNGLFYSGDSSIIDYQGNTILQKTDEPFVATQTLSFDALVKYRNDFPAWKDADTERD